MGWTKEAKVGFFSLVAIVVFVLCLLFLGRANLFSPPQMTVTAHFTDVTGLKVGNPVTLSGMDVGRVTSMAVSNHGVDVKMNIKQGTKIPVDSRFVLGQDGVLGEKVIAITPGNSSKDIQDGATIVGAGNSDIQETLQTATALMKEANKTIASINAIVGDSQTQTALRNALRSTEVIAQNTISLTNQMNAMLAENRGNVNQLTTQMVAISKNMNDVTAQLNQTMGQFNKDGQAGTDMRAILDNLKTTSDSVKLMAKSMEGVVTDPQAQADIKQTLYNTAQLTGKLNALTGGKPYSDRGAARQVNDNSSGLQGTASARGQAGNGAQAALGNGAQAGLANGAQAGTLSNGVQAGALNNGSQATGAQIIGNQTPSTGDQTNSNAAAAKAIQYPFSLRKDVDVTYGTTDHEKFVNAMLHGRWQDKRLDLGLSHIGDGTSLEATYGNFFYPDWSWRLGLIDGQLGGALDYGWNGPFLLEAAFFNLNHFTYRLRGDVELFPDTYGYFTYEKQDGQGKKYIGIKRNF